MAESTTAVDDPTTTGEDSTTGEPDPVEVCGDGMVQGREACDDGELNGVSGMSDCLEDCSLTVCGDGFLGTPDSEECDQGEENADDGACTSTCAIAFCGDDLVGPGESCDDGPKGSDECTSECALASCGDGIVQAGEECDDENDISTDACVNCVEASCGDGVIEAGEEQCDDGAANASDPPTCAYGVTEEDCTYCEAISCFTEQGIVSYCGDGTIQDDEGEVCDGTYSNATCSDCEGLTCSAGFGNCDGMVSNGCELDIETDADNCGECGNSCGAGGSCVAGECETQVLDAGSFVDVDFLETPDDPNCLAALWYLDTEVGSVSRMCLAGAAVDEPEGEQYNGGVLSFFWQDTLEIAPSPVRFAYLHATSNDTIIGSASTGVGRRSGAEGANQSNFEKPAATSHVFGGGSSPTILASQYSLELFPTTYRICMDAMDVPTLLESDSGNEGVCVDLDASIATALVGVRFGGAGTSDFSLFAYANPESELCLARGTAAGSETGVNPDPGADGGASDDLEEVEVQCTDIGALLGGANETIDGLGTMPGRSASMPVRVFASSDGAGSIRLFETDGGTDLDLAYSGDVAVEVQVEPGSEIFVPRPGSDPSDGDEYIYWYWGTQIYRATNDTGNTIREGLHTVPSSEGDLLEVAYYDGFLYYGTTTGIYRLAL